VAHDLTYWTRELDREIDLLVRAPYFAVYPSGLHAVCHEMRRSRRRRSVTPTLDDAIISNARVLLDRLQDARHDLNGVEHARLVRHVDKRLDAAAGGEAA
jgi:hypothetical protein